jgi:hypothetical protein
MKSSREAQSTNAKTENRIENDETASFQVPKGRPQPRNTQSTCSALYSNRNVVYCSFCSKNHPTLKCNVVTDTTSRKAVLKRKGKCFISLKGGHLAKQCQSQHNCHKCGGRHHTAICDTQQPQNSTTNAPTAKTETKKENKKESGDQSTNSLHGLYVSDNNSVLLQTAKARVSNPNTQCTVNTRLIFDLGSQRSYITTHMRNTLALPSIGSSNLLIKTFAEKSNQTVNCDIVQLRT